jgi:hypothetical protein
VGDLKYCGLVGVTTGCLVGFELGELRGLLIGMGIGSMMSFVVPAFRLAHMDIASPSAEIRYTLLGVALAAIATLAADYSAPWVPLSDSLRTFVVGAVVLSPYGIWTGLRVLREVKQR